MSDTNEELAVSTDEDGAAEALAWLDANTQTKEEATPPEAVEPEQSEEVPASEEPEAEAVESEVNPEGEPEPTSEAEDSVLKYLPDGIRSDFEAAQTDEEKQSILQKAFLLQADYTRKTQELARERERVKDVEQKAQWWEQLSSDPSAISAMADKTDEDDFDFVSAEPNEVKAKIREEAKALLDEERTALQQEEAADIEYKAGLALSLNTWSKVNQLDEAVVDMVTKSLGERLALLGVDPHAHISAENLPSILDKEYADIQAKSALEASRTAAEKSKSDTTRAARASSPPSSRASSIKDQDPWVAEGRPPKPGEIAGKTIKELRDLGVDFDSLV